MSETQEAEGEGETINKTKRIVVKPVDDDTRAFVDRLVDEDMYARSQKTYTSTTYTLTYGGVTVEIDENLYDQLEGESADGASVDKVKSTNKRTEFDRTPAYSFRGWVCENVAHEEIGDVEQNTYWPRKWEDGDGNKVMSVRGRTKESPIPKPYDYQTYNDFLEDEEAENTTIHLRFVCKNFPAEHEEELDSMIGDVCTMLSKKDGIDVARPVKCFEVEKTKEVCPRL